MYPPVLCNYYSLVNDFLYSVYVCMHLSGDPVKSPSWQRGLPVINYTDTDSRLILSRMSKQLRITSKSSSHSITADTLLVTKIMIFMVAIPATQYHIRKA